MYFFLCLTNSHCVIYAVTEIICSQAARNMLIFPTFWLWKTDYICIFLKALSQWAWADFPASFYRWYLTCFWTCYCYRLSRINPSTQQFALKYYLIIHCTSERQPCPCDICGVSLTYLFNFILWFILVSVSVPWVLAYSQPICVARKMTPITF